MIWTDFLSVFKFPPNLPCTFLIIQSYVVLNGEIYKLSAWRSPIILQYVWNLEQQVGCMSLRTRSTLEFEQRIKWRRQKHFNMLNVFTLLQVLTCFWWPQQSMSSSTSNWQDMGCKALDLLSVCLPSCCNRSKCLSHIEFFVWHGEEKINLVTFWHKLAWQLIYIQLWEDKERE